MILIDINSCINKIYVKPSNKLSTYLKKLFTHLFLQVALLHTEGFFKLTCGSSSAGIFEYKLVRSDCCPNCALYLQLKYYVAKMRGHFWFVGS